jgi:hypothetical protein
MRKFLVSLGLSIGRPEIMVLTLKRVLEKNGTHRSVRLVGGGL